jgi:hypothetical protein
VGDERDRNDAVGVADEQAAAHVPAFGVQKATIPEALGHRVDERDREVHGRNGIGERPPRVADGYVPDDLDSSAVFVVFPARPELCHGRPRRTHGRPPTGYAIASRGG